MKKRMLVLLLFAITLSGCSQSINDEYIQHDVQFVTVSRELYGDIIYDKRTGVEYWRSKGNANGSLTLLVDKDGKPLIYAGE